jgi:beta-1,4-N-acetylglucosaminyltransferase
VLQLLNQAFLYDLFLKMTKDKRRTIFVTVGTTLFESLIEAIVSPRALAIVASKGFTHVILQHGKGKAPRLPDNCPVHVEYYDFKPSLREDMLAADLIVSHAGAGTVMEVLGLDKKESILAVVINSRLMDNHQLELAKAMGDRRHLFVIQEPELLQKEETWDELVAFVPLPKEPGDAQDFARVLDSYFGCHKLK